MPPAKRRRSTKHRGNAAGMIEARGRTGRKPTAAEKGRAGARGATSSARRSKAGEPKPKRYERPPTWKSAIVRAVVAAAVVYVISIALLKRTVSSGLVLVPIILVLYAPMIYYTDLWMYRRMQRKRAAAR